MTADMMCESIRLSSGLTDILVQAQLGCWPLITTRTRCPISLIDSGLCPIYIPSITIPPAGRLRHRDRCLETLSPATPSYPLRSTTTGLPTSPLSPTMQGGTRPRLHPRRCPRSYLQERCLLLPTLFLCGTCLRWVTMSNIGFWLQDSL